MNESDEKDDTDQEEGDEDEDEDERNDSSSDLIASNVQDRIDDETRQKIKELQDKLNKKSRELDEIEKGMKNEIGEEEWGKMGEGEKIKKIRDEWNKRQEEEMKKNKAKAEKVKEKKKLYGEDEPAEIDLSTPEVTPTSNNTSSDGGEKVKKEKDSGDAVESTKKSAAKIMNVKGAKTRILDSALDSEGIHTGKVFPSWQKDSYVISMCDPNVENIPPKSPEISNAQPEGATMKTWDIDEAIKERQK